MSERQAGWYWVRIAGHWRPCEWSDDYWIEPDFISGLGWDDFDEVGPRVPAPDEPWQTVPMEPTPEMLNALYGDKFVGTEAADEMGYWAGMLSAAPKPS